MWHTSRTEPVTKVQATDANLGTLGSLQKQQLSRPLGTFIEDGVFPIDPERVSACIDGELEPPLINESCTPWLLARRKPTKSWETPVIHRAVEVLTNPAALARRQQDNAHFCQVRKSLCDSGVDVLVICRPFRWVERQTIFHPVRPRFRLSPNRDCRERPLQNRFQRCRRVAVRIH